MMARSKIFIFVIISSLIMVISCATKPILPTRYPVAFDAAIQALSNDLMIQIEQERKLANVKADALILLDPFVNAATNEVISVSRDIEKIIIEEGEKSFTNFTLNRMTSKKLRDADYVMNGTIHLVPYKVVNESTPEKYYNISSSVIDLKTSEIVAHSSVWISDYNIDNTSVSIYQDSPMYLKDPSTKGAIKTATSQVGTEANKNYYDSLETIAILTEAGTAYENKDYDNALSLFKQASERQDGQLMRTYAGLYSTYRKLKDMENAAKSFSKLLGIGVEDHQVVTVKFLFDVNSVEFWKDPELIEQYELWIRLIGQYFQSSQYCLEILGHSSRSGAKEYNEQLSLDRAKRIQQLLQANFDNALTKTKAIGKGFSENIVGIGTDDARDAIDRRVEFVVTGCN